MGSPTDVTMMLRLLSHSISQESSTPLWDHSEVPEMVGSF
jgi:hypothetical protein